MARRVDRGRKMGWQGLLLAALSVMAFAVAASLPIQAASNAPPSARKRSWPRRPPFALRKDALAPAKPSPAPKRWTLLAEKPEQKLGLTAGPAGDVNGDGFDDIFAGGPLGVFYGSPNGLPTTASWQPDLTGPGTVFAAAAGDVNGDGFDDFLVYAPDMGVGNLGRRAFLFYGSASGLAAKPDWTYVVPPELTGVVAACACAGDVNGDGFADVVISVGFFQDFNGSATDNVVLVFHGSRAGLASQPAWRTQCYWQGEAFGAVVASADDVNGDGFDDLVVGAPGNDEKARDSGRVYVYHGSRFGLSPTPNWSQYYPRVARKDIDEAYQQFFGASVGCAGDVNGDGYDDLIVGAWGAERDDLGEGIVFVYHGSSQGLSPRFDWTAEANQMFGMLGWSVSGAGDVNGDGFDDVVAGARRFSDMQLCEGGAFVFHGSSRGLGKEPAWSAESDRTEDEMGWLVAGVGDVNGDGFADVLATSPHTGGGAERGRVFVYYGTAEGLSGSFNVRLGKPFLLWANWQWQHLSTLERFGVVCALVLSSLGGAALLLVWSRRRRLAVVHAAREAAINVERQRIARDIHDEAGGRLTRLSLLAGELAEDRELERASLIRKIQATTRDLSRTLGHIIWGLRPGQHSVGDVVDFLGDCAHEMLAPTGLRCVLDLPVDFPVACVRDTARQNLLAAFKEAINNALKHSKASEVVIKARCEGASLTVEVADNGQGLTAGPMLEAEAASGARFSGNGFYNMRDRLKASGGRFEMHSPPSGGLTLRFTVPIFPVEPQHLQPASP